MTTGKHVIKIRGMMTRSVWVGLDFLTSDDIYMIYFDGLYIFDVI